MLWIVLSSFGSGIRLWHPCHHGTVRYCLKPVPIASKGLHANMSNASFLFVALNQRAFCESLVTRLGQASFVATAKFNIACAFDGEAPFLSNIFCCLMPQKISLNSVGWRRSTPLSIASLPRSTQMINTVRASILPGSP